MQPARLRALRRARSPTRRRRRTAILMGPSSCRLASRVAGPLQWRRAWPACMAGMRRMTECFSFLHKSGATGRRRSALYAACVAAARRPALYTRLMACRIRLRAASRCLRCISSAPIQRLMHEPGDDPELARLLAEQFVADMDAAFREMGVSDVSIPKRMKALYRSFAGRISAYRTALGEGEAALVAAVARNVFPDGEADGVRPSSHHALEAAVAGDRAQRALPDLRRGECRSRRRPQRARGGACDDAAAFLPSRFRSRTIPAGGRHFRLEADREARRRAGGSARHPRGRRP